MATEKKQYLDKAGVTSFWAKVKGKVSAAQTDLQGKIDAVDAKVDAVEAKITALGSVLSFKGTKANVAALPSTGNKEGDVWHVTEKSAEYVWDGSKWEEIGSTVDLTAYLTKEDAEKLYAAKNHTHAASDITDLNTAVDARVPVKGVQFNGTNLTPDSNKKVNIQAATAEQGAKADTALQPGDMVAITDEEINEICV